MDSRFSHLHLLSSSSSTLSLNVLSPLPIDRCWRIGFDYPAHPFDNLSRISFRRLTFVFLSLYVESPLFASSTRRRHPLITSHRVSIVFLLSLCPVHHPLLSQLQVDCDRPHAPLGLFILFHFIIPLYPYRACRFPCSLFRKRINSL